jgi:type IV secretory pathway TrbD component
MLKMSNAAISFCGRRNQSLEHKALTNNPMMVGSLLGVIMLRGLLCLFVCLFVCLYNKRISRKIECSL